MPPPQPPPPPSSSTPTVTAAPPTVTLRATVRIDGAVGGTSLDGVWLELADGRRFVIDRQPDELWRGFADQLVDVTGGCYQPVDRATDATAFEVETLATVAPGPGPLATIGPRRTVDGAFVDHTWPAGSRRAGTSQRVFRAADGTTYWIAGGGGPLPAAGTAARIEARAVEPSPTYAATPGGEHLWLITIDAPDAAAPSRLPCP